MRLAPRLEVGPHEGLARELNHVGVGALLVLAEELRLEFLLPANEPGIQGPREIA